MPVDTGTLMFPYLALIGLVAAVPVVYAAKKRFSYTKRVSAGVLFSLRYLSSLNV